MSDLKMSEFDREFFQLLITNKLYSKTLFYETFLSKDTHKSEYPNLTSEMTSKSTIDRRVNDFCERNQCRIWIQIIDWQRIGLTPFFLLSERPFTVTITPDGVIGPPREEIVRAIEERENLPRAQIKHMETMEELKDLKEVSHPYAVRQYKLIGGDPPIQYLTLFVTPDESKIPREMKDPFEITRIHGPTNEINLLYDKTRTISYNDEWLLHLKEVMVEQEHGDLMTSRDPSIITEMDDTPIKVTDYVIERLSMIFSAERRRAAPNTGLIEGWNVEFVESYRKVGLLTPYVDIQFPNMQNYIIILKDTARPELFSGGFLYRFPLTELYECNDTLICRILYPEFNFSKLCLQLFTHLNTVCDPNVWILREDKWLLQFDKIWKDGDWKKFPPIK